MFRFITHKPGLHKKMSGRSKRTPTLSQKPLEVARHQHQKRGAARGAKSVAFAGMGERHASQVEARGGEEASDIDDEVIEMTTTPQKKARQSNRTGIRTKISCWRVPLSPFQHS